MALYESPWANLALGLASLKNPGLLSQALSSQEQEAERARKAEEDNLRLSLLKQQQGAQQNIAGLLGTSPTMAGAKTYGMGQDEQNRMLASELARSGDVSGAMSLLAPSKDTGFTLSPGQTRFDAQGRPITSVGAEVDTVSMDKQRKSLFDMEKDLRGEYGKETKTFTDINDAYGRIGASATNPSPAGDMALIFNYMKMLDPGSTVREGEYATARDAGSVPDRIIATYNKAVKGEGLSPSQRADFVMRAEKLFTQAATQYEQRANQYTKLAERNQLNPANVVIDRNLFRKYAPQSPEDKFTGEYLDGFPIYKRPNGKRYAVGE